MENKIYNDNVIKLIIVFLFIASFQIRNSAQSFELVDNFEDMCQLQHVTGLALADYDLDDDLDIFIVSVHRYEEGDDQTWSRLLRNNGQNDFTDVTLEAKLFDPNVVIRPGWMGDRLAASWGDYDNDGYPDLFISNNGEDELWHNEGDGTFQNVAEVAGVKGCFDCYSSNGLWWDYDLDGDLDLYVSDWSKENRMHRNNGDGTFTDISVASGLNNKGKTWSTIPIDVNKDLLPDLYVVNDIDHNFLLVNDGSGNFYDATSTYGVRNDGDGMGVDICDYNNDGNFDIYVTNIYVNRPNPFFVSNGFGKFTDYAKHVGIDDTGWGWGARFFDADHDMDEDLYVVNGMSLSGGRGDKNFFFKNNEGLFEDISFDLGVDSDIEARSLEVFDYDLDGDLDMIVGNQGAPVSFYKNTLMENGGADNNWIQIKLEGTESNRSGLGSVVEIICEGKSYFRHFSGANIFGQSLKPIHFGLSDNQKIDEVAVTWTTGKKEYFGSASANQLLKLKEGTGNIASTFHPEIIAEKIQQDFTIFPNPFHENIILDFQSLISGQVEFQLKNFIGQVVFEQNLKLDLQSSIEMTIPDGQVQTGVYFYSLKTEKGINCTGKLLKR